MEKALWVLGKETEAWGTLKEDPAEGLGLSQLGEFLALRP